MSARIPWFERRFQFDLPVENHRDVLERLRGTPARLEERCREVPEATARRRDGERWSLQENAGHLLDLEPLWDGRTDDFLRGVARMRPADLENRKTHAAHHNEAGLADLLAAFRDTRLRWCARLGALSAADFARTSQHPRLEQSMRLLDLCLFVAAHDDRHLARIGELIDR